MTERYRLRSITKRYGSNVAVDIDALTIDPGRLYTLTGPNGAGKSTLLGILAFLIPPTTGEIFYAGERIDGKGDILRRRRRNVTLLHQSPYLFGGTVFRNVAYGLKARGVSGGAALRAVDRALETVGLKGFRDRDARELSGGEAQRVAMARALALDPEVLLLDEPLANIDRETAMLLETVIASLPSRGTTVVMTTHDPDHPSRRNGGSIVLEGGKITSPRNSLRNQRGKTRMPTYEEARSIVLESVTPVGAERVETGRALGRTLAEEVAAPWPLPFCDNSAMDGYAVRADDCRGPARLKITGYIPAGGSASAVVTPGCAVKIMTGAPIPPGCDAVIPFEETEVADDHVVVTGRVTVRQHIRFRAEDVREGDVVLPEGTPLRPPEISMLASLGKPFVPVYRKVRVAVLSTGDELIELGEPPAPGMIINSNSLAIAAAVREAGAEAVLLGIARDELASHAEKISEGLKADALITTAGVSAGDRDLVREVLGVLGVVSRFWRVDIKPGGPTAFGIKDGKPVFSLPGNPVSALITFEAFVRPALLRMMGRKKVVRPLVKATLTGEVRKKPGKVNFLRVGIEIRDGDYFASSAGDQNTGILRTMVLADALAVLPADKTSFAAGETVDVFLLSETLR